MSTKRIICVGVLICSFIFKFWLIAEMEITDDSDDPTNYVAQIISGGPSFFGPGTGLIGSLFHAIGIPFRDGIEIGYLLACLLVVKALFDWPTKSYLALGLFVFVSFNPAPEELFSHIMSDQVCLVETLIGLALFVAFAGTSKRIRWLYLVYAGVSLGFSTITRLTLVPIIVSFISWFLLYTLVRWLKNGQNIIDFPVIGGLAACLAVVGAVNYTTCFYNSISYGYFGVSLSDSVEFHNFYMCLQSVGDPTGDKYYPVDANRLGLVARAGPVSYRFVERMNTDLNFRKISQNAYGKYDLAFPWFVFPVFFNTIPNGDLRQGFAMFRDVENEIHQAAREHRLKVRTILPLPDCRVGIVLSDFPAAMQRTLSSITVMPDKYAWAMRDNEPHFEDADFSLALTRSPVIPSPLRENMGKTLCASYSMIYSALLWGLGLSIGAFLYCVVSYWKKLPAFRLHFMAQQIFAIYFVVFFFMYALFSASGLVAVPRYMIFQNVMLPLLLVYYFRQAWQIMRGHHDAL